MNLDREREKIERALQLFRDGDTGGAERLLRRIVNKAPTHVGALYLLGVLLHRSARPQDAIRYLARAAKAQANNPEIHNTLGAALLAAGRVEDAIDSLTRAIILTPSLLNARINRANLLASLERFDEAAVDFEAVVELDPHSAAAYLRLAELHMHASNLERALAILDKALSVDPFSAEAHCIRGNALIDLGRIDEALSAYDRAISFSPQISGFHLNRAHALAALGRSDAAILAYDQAVGLAPSDPEAYVAKARLLRQLNMFEESFTLFNKALALDPLYQDALAGRAANLVEAGFLKDALRDYETLAEQRDDENYLIELRGFMRRQMCDWSLVPAELEKIEENLRDRKPIASAFAILSISSSECINLSAAKLMTAQLANPPVVAVATPAVARGSRIKLAYISADFHDHATAHLLAGVIEHADRDQFELIGLSFGPDRQDAYRARIASAVDSFLNVRSLSDVAVARLSRELGIDIALDLKGLTKGHRIGIFAHRASPIQINYLGYPASSGADFMDYIVADRVVASDCNRSSFVEKVISLPDAYQPNDPNKIVSNRRFTRAEVGLPDDAFVFCCFNNSYKILPDIFDVWMRILQQTPRSVLWLIRDNEWQPENLRREAQCRGIEGKRLIFSPRIALAEHLARHRLADLFLDTLPYNAHTTASDALFMGVPVLTCAGCTFAGRVAASLLKAAGLRELIAENLADYEALAVEAATFPESLFPARAHLNTAGKGTPLFDVRRYARNLEKAFTVIYRRHVEGREPTHIFIDD